jgi:phosphonate transport system substrate-binding protein
MRASANRCLALRLAVALCAPALIAGPARAADPAPLKLAVVPNLPPVTLHKLWTPFVERLSRDTGLPIALKLYDRVGVFLDECDAGSPDLLFAAPNMFFLSHRKQGYVPLVRSERKLVGTIFVRKESPYRTIADLRGKSIAFVGPRNICSVITRHALATAGTPIDFNASFTGSTVNVAKSVLLGKADAGATLDGALVTDVADALPELRTILETPPVASHPLAAHPRVPPDVRERIAQAILALARTEDGQKLLASVRLASPIRADFDRDYRLFDDVDFEALDRQGRAEP